MSYCTQCAAEVDRLIDGIAQLQEIVNSDVAEIERLRAEVERLRAAATALIDFHNGPREAKRPDVFHLLMARLNAALEKETSA